MQRPSGSSRSAFLNQFRELIPNRSARWLLVAAFWTVLGLVSSVVWMLLSPEETQPYTWSQLIGAKLLVWWLWGGITVFILNLAARLSLLGKKRFSRGCWLLVLSLVITVGYMFGYSALIFFTQPTAIVGPDYLKLARWALWTHWGYFYVGFWLTVALEHFAAQLERMHAAGMIRERLEKELTRARLDQVRQQMHPHFLFNTLNTISSHILTGDRHQAYELATGLASYLRRGLELGEAEFIPVQTELELAGEYLLLVQARFHDRLQIEVTADEASRNLAIPSLLLQPFVENAVTHAVARSEQKTRLEIDAGVNGDRLLISVRNSRPQGERDGLHDPAQRTRLGLQRSRERLQLIYGDQASLEISADNERTFLIQLNLPARMMPARPDQRDNFKPAEGADVAPAPAHR